jgi:hypothetical protein
MLPDLCSARTQLLDMKSVRIVGWAFAQNERQHSFPLRGVAGAVPKQKPDIGPVLAKVRLALFGISPAIRVDANCATFARVRYCERGGLRSAVTIHC